MKKIVYIVLDGLGDLPIKELGGKTPLEAALTPHMDRLAQKGRTGCVYPAGKGLALESDVAVISLLGYDARLYYTGRGPLEAFAQKLSMQDGNLAVRVNFATVDGDGQTIKERRAARDLTIEEVAALVKELNSKVSLSNATFEFAHTVGHRGILVIKGMHCKLSGWITNTDPAYAREGMFGVAKETFENVVAESVTMETHRDACEAKEAAGLLNEFTQKAHRVLNEAAVNKKRVVENKLPVNAILSRGAGDRLPQFPPLAAFYGGISFGAFVEMPVERGIALLTGMDIVDVPQSSGHLDVDYPVWAKVALDAITRLDAVYIHIKGPDEPAHDGDYLKKKEIIEYIDKYFFASLIPHIDLKNAIICVAADHSTACAIKAHTADPVPFLVSGGTIKADGSMSFSEKAAKLGSLGEITGQQLLPLLIKFAKE